MHERAGYPQMGGQGADAPLGGIRRPGFQGGVQNFLLQLGGQDAPGTLALLTGPDGLDASLHKGGASGDDGRARNAELSRDGVIGQAV